MTWANHFPFWPQCLQAQWAGWTCQSLGLLVSSKFSKHRKSLSLCDLWHFGGSEAFQVTERFIRVEVFSAPRHTLPKQGWLSPELFWRLTPNSTVLCVCALMQGLFSTCHCFCLFPTALGGSTLTRYRGTQAQNESAVWMVGKHLIG